MKQVTTISVGELSEMANLMFGVLVKGVVDIKRRLLAVDAELHADLEAYLLKNGSEQKDLWGINLYPSKFGKKDFVEFDSMINIRPSQNNMSRGVNNDQTRRKIMDVVKDKVTK